MARLAGLCIDMTNDFVHDQGCLSAKKPAQVIVPAIIATLDAIQAGGGIIVDARDAHAGGVDHHWPRHNNPGSWGWEHYGELKNWFAQRKLEEAGNSAPDQTFWITKGSYNAFWNTGLATLLRSRTITTVVLTGVCTDICVMQTGFGAFDEGFSIIVPRNAVATFSPHGEIALEFLKNYCAATIVERFDLTALGGTPRECDSAATS